MADWYTFLPLDAIQTGVLWPFAPLESVASSVENAAELQVSSLTDCLCPGPGRGTFTSLHFTGVWGYFSGA